MPTEYVFDTASELGGDQMTHLATLYDSMTFERLERAGVRDGFRCLEIGAGGGSVARWLANCAAPGGEAVATDVDVTRLADAPGLTVHEHDINDGLPPGGPFDLVHARLVLMHLVRRQETLSVLADGIAPGGSLVTADLTDRPPRVLEAPSPADAELFGRILDVGMNVLAPQVGISFSWAHEVGTRMAAAGLAGVETHTVHVTSSGGGAGCLLFGNYMGQLEPYFLDLGYAASDLARFRELATEPRMRVEFFELVYTSGHRDRAGGADVRWPKRRVGDGGRS